MDERFSSTNVFSVLFFLLIYQSINEFLELKIRSIFLFFNEINLIKQCIVNAITIVNVKHSINS